MSIPVFTEQLYTIWGTSSDDVFAIGADEDSGVVLHLVGNRWREVPFIGADYEYYLGVWGIPGRYFFVKYISNIDEGIIVEYDGQDWSEIHTGVAGLYTDIWGSSLDDIFAVGYSMVDVPEGVRSRIMHFDGEIWSEMEDNFSTALFSVWGSSSTDVFAVGAEGDPFSSVGTILHYDGNSWSVMEEDVTYRLFSVSGSSKDNVYVSGESGIMRYDGNIWTEVSNRGSGDIWVSPNSEVFMFGGETVRYSDGNSWINLCNISYDVKENVGLSYYGVWGASKDDVFAVGTKQHPESYSEGIILRSNFKDDLNCLCE